MLLLLPGVGRCEADTEPDGALLDVKLLECVELTDETVAPLFESATLDSYIFIAGLVDEPVKLL